MPQILYTVLVESATLSAPPAAVLRLFAAS
jgi:hypothetical protein